MMPNKRIAIERALRAQCKEIVFAPDVDENTRSERLEALWNTQDYLSLTTPSQHLVKGYATGLIDGQLGHQGLVTVALNKRFIAQKAERAAMVPPEIASLQPDAKWRRHSNGKGWVSSTAYVQASAYVASGAVVYERARVIERARVYGTARICGQAEVYGAAHVHGEAIVRDHARVFDAAKILGRVIIEGRAQVGGLSLVRGTTRLTEGEHIDKRVTSDDGS